MSSKKAIKIIAKTTLTVVAGLAIAFVMTASAMFAATFGHAGTGIWLGIACLGIITTFSWMAVRDEKRGRE